MANAYEVEVTPEIKALGEEAIQLALKAAEKWSEFVAAATGDVDEGTAGGTLDEAIDDMSVDFTRFDNE